MKPFAHLPMHMQYEMFTSWKSINTQKRGNCRLHLCMLVHKPQTNMSSCSGVCTLVMLWEASAREKPVLWCPWRFSTGKVIPPPDPIWVGAKTHARKLRRKWSCPRGCGDRGVCPLEKAHWCKCVPRNFGGSWLCLGRQGRRMCNRDMQTNGQAPKISPNGCSLRRLSTN